MQDTSPNSTSAAATFVRRVRVLTVVFAILLLLDFVVFGWFLFRSLSQRELERVLLETRVEAQAVADELSRRVEESGELPEVIRQPGFETELAALARRTDIESVLVRTSDGVLVFSRGAGQQQSSERGELSDLRVALPGASNLEVPIRGMGTLVVGFSRQELSQRVEDLRLHLLRMAGIVAVLTTGLLLIAYLSVSWLYRRGRRLEEQAVASERLAYLGTLASGLAHEIRNPLNAVNLNLQMLEEGAGDSRGRLFEITRSEVKRLERLVTDFLAYAKPRPIEREWLQVDQVLAEAADLARGAFEESGVRLELQGPQSDLAVWVDEEQTKQVIYNLLNNALAVSREAGGEVVRLWGAKKGEEAILAVSDRGPGVPEEERDKIFEVFYSKRRGGTGLGLAIVSRFADAHGAKVEVAEGRLGWPETTVLGGTTVSLRFSATSVRAKTSRDRPQQPVGDLSRQAN